MILLIIKTYLYLFIPIGMGSFLMFILGLYFIVKKPKFKNANDFVSIAGDDLIATQLDLARAFIETEQLSLAKEILTDVIVKGTRDQKKEAKQLMKTCLEGAINSRHGG